MRIIGFESYEVTPKGEVINTRTGRILKPDTNRTGYKRVTLSENNKLKRFFVHRLVALHYIANPYSFTEVNHKDGDKTNNSVENLEWVSSSQNKKHAVETGLRGSRKNTTYISEEIAHEVCKRLEEGMPYGKLSELLGVSYNIVCLIKTRKSWKTVSDSYNF